MMSEDELSVECAAARPGWAARGLMAMAARLRVGTLALTDPSGGHALYGEPGGGPHAELIIRDWRAAPAILRQGDIGFAESLRRGWVDSPDLLALFTLALRNEAALSQAVAGKWWALLARRLSHLFLRDNTRKGSRRNILSHYDLGNDFYRLWLDPSMSYSAALFGADRTESLQAAQHRKIDRLLDALNARPGQHVLEIGCGWGGFAERAAQRGLHVHGITLSDAQLQWARARMQTQGLDGRVTLELRDYRDLGARQYDHIVSIEMVEAVGERRWPVYFDTLARNLRSGGRVALQSIDIADAAFGTYRRGTDFIQQYIFPGGMLPCPRVIREQSARAGLDIIDEHAFGLDYADTLLRWRHAFDAQVQAVRAQGFDDAFIRLWRMYLCYCEAGFREGRTDVRHWVLEKRTQ
ncbi:SAM-dependent methyltransferase [Achromobacter kerstersii]|nr:cyclopropane-fatty-acyl-phospholipid synthase family protein [Achromobacter kerstersii]